MHIRRRGSSSQSAKPRDSDVPLTRAALRARAKKQEKGLLGYLGIMMSAVLLVVIASVAALVIIAPMIAGGQALTVLTSSMEPKLPPGTLIVIKPTSMDEIRVGDVVTFQITSGSPAVISHRVIQRTVSLSGETTLITKGDNNDLPDVVPVEEVQVKGTLWYAIPYLGWVNSVINGEARAVVTPIIAGLLFAYTVFTLVSAIRDRRRKARRVASARRSAAELPISEP